jgi:hypothetical protein
VRRSADHRAEHHLLRADAQYTDDDTRGDAYR